MPDVLPGAAGGSKAGLLWAMVLTADGRGRPMSGAEAFAMPGTFGSGFVWLHYDLGTTDAIGPTGDGRLGPTALLERVFSPDEHQRGTVEGEHVGAVVALTAAG